MDTKDQIKLYDSQIRNSYGNLFWTHKIHEKDADRFRSIDCWLKLTQIILSAVTTTGIFTSIFGDCRWVVIVSAILSFLLLGLNLYMRGKNYEELSGSHGSTATRLWELREDYLSLLYDIKAGTVGVDDVRRRRDRLQEKTLAVYSNAPRTTPKGYHKANKAIENNEPFFTKEEFNKLLPLDLQED